MLLAKQLNLLIRHEFRIVPLHKHRLSRVRLEIRLRRFDAPEKSQHSHDAIPRKIESEVKNSLHRRAHETVLGCLVRDGLELAGSVDEIADVVHLQKAANVRIVEALLAQLHAMDGARRQVLPVEELERVEFGAGDALGGAAELLAEQFAFEFFGLLWEEILAGGHLVFVGEGIAVLVEVETFAVGVEFYGVEILVEFDNFAFAVRFCHDFFFFFPVDEDNSFLITIIIIIHFWVLLRMVFEKGIFVV